MQVLHLSCSPDYEDVDKIKVAMLFVVDPASEGDNTVVDIESDHCSPFLAKKKLEQVHRLP